MIKHSFEDIIRNLLVGSSLFLISTYIYYKVSVYPICDKYKNKYIGIGCLCSSFGFVILNLINVPTAQITSFLFPSIFSPC